MMEDKSERKKIGNEVSLKNERRINARGGEKRRAERWNEAGARWNLLFETA